MTCRDFSLGFCITCFLDALADELLSNDVIMVYRNGVQ